jgi:thiol:disulfide interchange protein DsbD
LEVRVPLQRQGDGLDRLDLDVGFQGCADEGICYPPQSRIIALTVPPLARRNVPPPGGGALDGLSRAFQALGAKSGAQELLPADQAFRLVAEVRDASTLWVGWQIADG